MSSEPKKTITRRQFLRLGFGAAIGLLIAQTSAIFAWMLWPKTRRQLSEVYVGNVADYQVGDVKIFELPQNNFFVAKVRENGFLALSGKCTHLGYPVYWETEQPSFDSIGQKGQFHCRAHGSGFDRLGVKHAGPAPRPMDLYSLTITKDGEIFVDPTKTIMRNSFEETQVTRKE